jgi:hypothetical protein
LAVDEKAQPGGAAGTVVGRRDVDPLPGRQGGRRADGGGVARPEADQGEAQAALVEGQFDALK